MTNEALLRKLQVHLEAAMRQQMYGHIEIELKAGRPMFLRVLHQEKLDEQENRRGRYEG